MLSISDNFELWLQTKTKGCPNKWCSALSSFWPLVSQQKQCSVYNSEKSTDLLVSRQDGSLTWRMLSQNSFLCFSSKIPSETSMSADRHAHLPNSLREGHDPWDGRNWHRSHIDSSLYQHNNMQCNTAQCSWSTVQISSHLAHTQCIQFKLTAVETLLLQTLLCC